MHKIILSPYMHSPPPLSRRNLCTPTNSSLFLFVCVCMYLFLTLYQPIHPVHSKQPSPHESFDSSNVDSYVPFSLIVFHLIHRVVVPLRCLLVGYIIFLFVGLVCVDMYVVVGMVVEIEERDKVVE